MKLLKKFLARALLAISFLMLTACTAQNPGTVQTPPAPSSLDLKFAQALNDAQAAIDGTPGNPGLRALLTTSNPAALNKILAAYNTALSAYTTWHAAFKAGSSPDPAALQAQIAQLSANVSAAIQLFSKP